jgi:predicted RNase H-like HicB family nuclease
MPLKQSEQMESGRWYAHSTEHPGAWADGDTEEEALQELDSVIEGWLIVQRRMNESGPPK